MKTRLAAVALLLIGAAGCHRNDKANDKAEKLAALESAYQSGVFTKQEYEAKKAALLGPPAASAPASAPAQPAPTAPGPAPANAAPPAVAPTPVRPARPPSPPAPTRAAESKPRPAPTGGCEDAESQAGKEKGVQERFYPAPVGAVKKAAEAALNSLDFTIHKDASNDIEASKRRHVGVLIGAGGERVLLHFARSQQGNQVGTLVTGETKKRLVGRMAQKSWTNAVLAQIGCQLKAR